MANQAELVVDLNSVIETLTRIGTETDGLQTAVNTLNVRVVDLEAVIAALGAGEASPELVAAVAAVKAAAQAVDDKVPNVSTPPAE